jgi:hypothetical protein
MCVGPIDVYLFEKSELCAKLVSNKLDYMLVSLVFLIEELVAREG